MRWPCRGKGRTWEKKPEWMQSPGAESEAGGEKRKVKHKKPDRRGR